MARSPLIIIKSMAVPLLAQILPLSRRERAAGTIELERAANRKWPKWAEFSLAAGKLQNNLQPPQRPARVQPLANRVDGARLKVGGRSDKCRPRDCCY